ncbi:hypothetical protein RHSIM_Rhsim04G0139200 [Rhododendron simsii]|uniref:Putative E3 ubiquitin-protein ligase LIN N-terminal domain-containing protein n=1 Tax=Rhododendron simsii TaxID=118357 RepID=A0A834H444_RHOSS|nr:hypothetical protein RHSIM_Rhsim04G0139200 [Rhododendron simsii]
MSGYIRRYLKDETFRESVRRKCYHCLLERRNNEDLDNGIFANMELGNESTKKLVENPGRKKMKVLSKAYNDQMDIGTTQFPLYYMEWLKVGAQAPPTPSMPLPSRTICGLSRRRSLDSFTSRSSVKRRSMELDNTSRASINPWDFEEADHQACTHEDNVKQHCYPERICTSMRLASVAVAPTVAEDAVIWAPPST